MGQEIRGCITSGRIREAKKMTGQKRKEKKVVELHIVLEYEKVPNSDIDYLQQ